MQLYQPILVAVATALAILSYVPYIRSILKGKTRPSRATFGIWALISVVEVGSYTASGARSTLLLPLVYAIGGIAVFCLSLTRGVGGTQKVDLFCLAGALLGVICWVLTKNPHVALYLSMLASGFGFVPTIKKAYFQPETEDALAWSLSGVAAVLNVLAISNRVVYNYSYPLFMLVFDGLIALLAVFPNLLRYKTAELASKLD